MAKWSKNRVNPDDINNGNEYEAKDRPSREQLNAIVNNSFYASEKSAEALEKADSAFMANGTVVYKDGVAQATLHNPQQVETIYEMGTDISLNLGYDDGIAGEAVSDRFVIGDTKFFRFYLNVFATNEFHLGASGLIVEIGTNYLLNGFACANVYVPYLVDIIPQSNEFRVFIRIGNGKVFASFFYGGSDENDNKPIYAVTKIERVW